MASNITINTSALGYNWGLNNTYRVAITEGFVSEATGLRLPISANDSVLTFTTSANPPLVSSTSPANNTTANINIQSISITLDRTVLSPLTGNVSLYKSSGNVLVTNVAIANTIISGGTISANIVGFLEANVNYYVTTSANIVQDADGNKFSGITTGNVFAFTAPAAPALTSTYPANNSTDVMENTTISFSFDRNIYANSGNIFLYKVDSPNVLIKSYNIATSPNLSISGNTVSMNINGLLANSSSYYVYTSSNVVMDITQIKYPGITSNSIFRFTTSSLHSNDFPPSINPMSYNEDTITKIQSPLILPVPDYDTSSYTVNIASNVGIVDMTSTGSGGSFSWTYNNPGGNLVITGNRAQINSYLGNLFLEPKADFANNISLTYTITNPNSFVTTRTQNVIIDQINSETLNLNTSRSFPSNSTSQPFLSNPIQIGDNGAVGQTYSVTFSSTRLKFAAGGQGPAYSITLTGDKSTVNSEIQNLVLWPDPAFGNNTTVSYTQIRNGITQVTASISFVHTGQGFTPRFVEIGATATWSPDANDIYYGALDATIVGAGGGTFGAGFYGQAGENHGLGGGGGGGAVVNLLNLPITAGTYRATVGAGAFNAAGGQSTLQLSNGTTYVAPGGQRGSGFYTGSSSDPRGPHAWNKSGGASGSGQAGGQQTGFNSAYSFTLWNHGGGGGGAGGPGSRGPTGNNQVAGGAGGAGAGGIDGTVYGGGGGGYWAGVPGPGGGAPGQNGVDGLGGGAGGATSNSSNKGGNGRVLIRIKGKDLQLLSVPGAPTIASITAESDTTANIQFVAPANNGGDPITSYTARSVTGNITATVNQASSGFISVSGLTPRTSISFVVSATNSIGQSANSSPSSVTTRGVSDAPTISSIKLNGNVATISYQAPTNLFGGTISSYTAVSNIGNLSTTLSTSASGDIVVYNLQDNTTYKFIVYATNEYGNSANSAPSANVGLTIPNAPSNVSATIASANTVSVSYTPSIANYGGDILSYTANSNVGNYTASTTSGNILLTIPDLSIPYSFTVYATNAFGNSNVSASSNAVSISSGLSSASYPGTNFSFLSGTVSSATGAGNYTFEGWFYNTDTGSPNERCIFDTRSFTGALDGWMLRNSGSSDFLFLLYGAGQATGFIASGRVNNTWQHLALVRNSAGIITLYVDGLARNSYNIGAYNYTSTFWRLGGFTDSSVSTGVYNGYIDEVRYSNTARYNNNFTPPSTYLSDSNTLLLLRMNGTNNSTAFLDSSPFNRPVTRGGTVNVPGGATGTGGVIVTTAFYKS